MSDNYYPHIFLPVDSWQYNVLSRDPRDDENNTVTSELILHGKTHVWGKYDQDGYLEVPFEIEIFITSKKAQPFGYLLPREDSGSDGSDSLRIVAPWTVDERTFHDLRECLQTSAKSERVGVQIIFEVDGLEMVDREYAWPKGKKLNIVGWTISLKYPNVKNGL